MQRRAFPRVVPMPPSLARLRSADLLIPIVLCLAFVLPLLLAFAGVGIRQSKNTPIVINEMFVAPLPAGPASYIELYNNTDHAISVDGWQIGNARENVVTLHGEIGPHAYLAVDAPNTWSSDADAVILRGVDGNQIDTVNWGAAPTQASPIINWADQAIRKPIPGTATVRNPQGFDSDATNDWLKAPVPPSPNAPTPASLTTASYRWLFDITNYVSLIAGFLLWGAFILIGLIAKRFEMLTGQRAFWLGMIVAPIGIVVYNAIQSYAFFTAGAMTLTQQRGAFSALLVSAGAMAYVVYRFYGIARRILEV